MATELIKADKFPQVFVVEDWVIVAGPDGVTKRIHKDDFKKFMGIGALMQMGGAITTASSPPAIGDFFWVATQSGSYPNFGNIQVPEKSLAVISRVDGAYSASITTIPVPENKIPDWTAGEYLSGRQVIKDGQIWEVKQSVSDTTEPPGSGNDWQLKSFPDLPEKDIAYSLLNGNIDTPTGGTTGAQTPERKHTKIDIQSGKVYTHNKQSVVGNSQFYAWDAGGAYLGLVNMPSPFVASNYPNIRIIGLNISTPTLDWTAFQISEKDLAIAGFVDSEIQPIQNKIVDLEGILSLPFEDLKYLVKQGSIDTPSGTIGSTGDPQRGYAKIEINPDIVYEHNKQEVSLNNLFNAWNKEGDYLGRLEFPSPIVPDLIPDIGTIGWNVKAPTFDFSAIKVLARERSIVTYVNRKVEAIAATVKVNQNLINPVRVADFMSDSTTISDAIDLAREFSKDMPFRTLIFDRADWIGLDRAILASNNTRFIFDGVKVKQSNLVFDNIIRGDNLEINPLDPNGYPLSYSPIDNVTIDLINGATLEGPDINAQMVHPVLGLQTAVGDFYGWRCFHICFSAGTNIKINGGNFLKTRSWAISFDFCSNVLLDGLYFDSNVKNGDGIDLRTGCHNFKIRNIGGSTSDDTVALNTSNDIIQHPHENYYLPLQPLKYTIPERAAEELNIHDVEISNINTTGNHHGIILLASTGRKIYNVVIDGVHEPSPSTRESVVKIYTGYGTGYNPNDIYNVRINDVLSKGAKYGVQTTVKVNDLWVNKVHQESTQEGAAPVVIADSEGVTLTNIQESE